MIAVAWPWRRVVVVGAALAALGGCDLAPLYGPPKYILPDDWRGQGPFARAAPGDAVPRGPWWEMFGDPVLNGLEQQLVQKNPTLAAMYEQYVQARDNAAIARSGLYPQLNVSGQLSYVKRSKNEPFSQNSQITTAPNNVVQAGATWQPGFWDRIRNGERMQARLAQSQAALAVNARLSLEGQLVNAYAALRGYDVLSANYRVAVANYQTSVRITRLRLAGAIAAGLDMARAEAQLASTQALQSANLASRAVVEHSIAVLVGANPSTFSIPPQERWTLANPPLPPTGVPSQLLERRPDIASAERQMAAANAGIGVTRAAFYPNITISGTGGFQDTGFALASLPNSLWSVGASAILPLFEGGLRRAELQQSWSQFAQTRDNYRATVLTAFGQVEDGLTLYASLQSQYQAQAGSVTASNRAQNLTEQLYVGGLINYVDVVVAQETALLAQISAAQTRTAQLQATANLLVAVGGGWSSAELPTEKGVLPFEPLDVFHFDRQPRSDGTGLENAAGQ